MPACENCARLEQRNRELEESMRRASESAQESEDRMSATIAQNNRELNHAARLQRGSQG